MLERSADTMTRLSLIPLFLILSFSLLPRAARADFFQYTDKDGTVVMVDDESKVPAQYRKKTRTTKVAPVVESRATPVRLRGNQAIVPVRISYRTTTVDVWLLLDTGATVTVISKSLADRLGIKTDVTESRLAQLADGRVIETSRARVDSMAVGPKLKNNAEVAIMPINGPVTGFDGLLGMSFLEGLRYHLDLNTQIIEWQ
jgi:clan AA aspartic protease (TIGR02281 family)